MRGLLDVNVLIALFDADHAFHERAHQWWAGHAIHGWASCPLSENGAVRIMSHPGYSRQMRLTPGDLIRRLKTFVANTDHLFWPDSVSLRDEARFAMERIHGSRQLTDIYLLGLAVENAGRLVTFDQSTALSTVPEARPDNLCVI